MSVLSRVAVTASFVLFPLLALFAQMKLTGKLVDATTKETLPGVTISIKGKKATFVSGIDGSFSIKVVDTDTLEFTAIGYLPKKISAKGSQGTIELTTSETTLKEVVVTNNIAIDRKTPVAVSTIRALQIEEASANKEFPELLESTPSVFVTNEGGGAGDSKLSIRGFDQTNIAVMVNGVPVNDMENGNVFWSNWSGLREIASSVQVQRGLGASKLSIAAVGGNVNIVTKATEMRAGTTITASAGNNDFYKTGVGFSTGKSKKGFAFSMLASRTSGKGYIAGTEYEQYNYFATAAWEINAKNTITATVTGAPQWHNQGTFALRYPILYGNPTTPSYVPKGPQYSGSWGFYRGEEFSNTKNFYHKPVANINYYLKLNSKTDISVVLYGSLGRGGGTANGAANPFSIRTADSLIRYDDVEKLNKGESVPGVSPSRTNVPWTLDGVYKGKYVVNGGTASSTLGYARRANMNEHNWYGTIINLSNRTIKNLTIDAGIDLRSYVGLHYSRVEDMFGADAYYEVGRNVNQPSGTYVANGDKDTKIFRNWNGIVKQYGGYLSGTYEKNKLTVFAAATVSNTSYQREDFFLYKPEDKNRKTAVKNFLCPVTKGGISYRFNNQHFAFFNTGYFEKAPFFNTVFYANDNTSILKNTVNEKVFGLEGGYGYRSPIVSVMVNVYRTIWKNKSLLSNTGLLQPDGTTQRVNITGLTAEHKGIELEATARPVKKLFINVMASLGDWKWKNNVISYVYDDNDVLKDSVKAFLDGLKVASTAQTTFGVGGSYEILKGLRISTNYRYLDNIYAQFAVTDRRTPSSRQAWKLPAYGLLNASVNYRFSFDGIKYTVRLNVDNILNKQYISRANTDIPYNKSTPNDFVIGDNGSGAQNQVYAGIGRTWVATLKINL